MTAQLCVWQKMPAFSLMPWLKMTPTMTVGGVVVNGGALSMIP